VFAEAGIRAVEEPEAPERVFHEVADDPMRSEELGDGRDVIGRHGALAGHDGVLFLRDVELVEPAEHLHLFPVLLAAIGHEFADERVRVEEVVWEQQDGGIIELAEDIRQDAVQLHALGEQEEAIEFLIAVASHLEADDLLEVEFFKVQMLGVLEDFRQAEALRVAEHAVAVAQPAIVEFHEADRHEPVEPSVGHGLHGGSETIALDFFPEQLAQRHDGARKRLAADECHVAGFGHWLHPVRMQSQHPGAAGDSFDECLACGGSVGFELREVHRNDAFRWQGLGETTGWQG